MDPSGENNKLYDLTAIYAITDNNPQFLDKLLVVFSDNIAKDVAGIKIAAAENNWAEVGQLAHKLKPSAAHFGITSLKDVIKNLERQGGQNADTLNALVIELDTIISAVLAGLKAEFPATFAT